MRSERVSLVCVLLSRFAAGLFLGAGDVVWAENPAARAENATPRRRIDPDARTEVDALKQAWGMLDYLPKSSPSPNFTNRTMERLTLETMGVTTGQSNAGAGKWPAWLVNLAGSSQGTVPLKGRSR